MSLAGDDVTTVKSGGAVDNEENIVFRPDLTIYNDIIGRDVVFDKGGSEEMEDDDSVQGFGSDEDLVDMEVMGGLSFMDDEEDYSIDDGDEESEDDVKVEDDIAVVGVKTANMAVVDEHGYCVSCLLEFQDKRFYYSPPCGHLFCRYCIGRGSDTCACGVSFMIAEEVFVRVALVLD